MTTDPLAALLLAALVFVAAGCGGAAAASDGWTVQGTNITRWHDPEYAVTCWAARNYGVNSIALSCLPDSEVKP